MNCANHPDRERVSFCQNCGKPLCSDCLRSVGSAVFCEPCLAARLAAVDAAAGTSSSYAAPPSFNTVPVPGVPPAPGTPNPVLAGALGLIPGVGAMYNGQFAKAAVHLIVFVVLVSLAQNFDAVGFLVAGWIFYQAFEAYHTARARQLGTPLPNPFGLNDIGERFGFGKAWPTPVAASAPGPGYAPQPGPQFVQAADGSQTFTGGDGTHFHQGADGSQSFRAADGTFFHQEPRPVQPPYTGPSWGAPRETYAAPVPPFTDPYTAPYPDPQLAPNRFPAGAIWLIALGLLFFFGSSGVFLHFPIHRLVPFLLIGLGIWLFVRKMTCTGQPLADDGTPAYRLRVFHALRGSVWVILVGVLFLLDTVHVLSWGRSWPLFIIVAGLMALFQRAAYTATTVPYGYPGPVAQPVPQPPAPAATSVVPYTSDKEGS